MMFQTDHREKLSHDYAEMPEDENRIDRAFQQHELEQSEC